MVIGVIEKVKSLVGTKTSEVVAPKLPVVVELQQEQANIEDLFFKLVVSWKQTRDLAVKSGCSEAVKVADQMFPFLSPTVCAAKEDKKL
jgi:hypothetical protein